MDERQQTWLLNILQANQGKDFVRRILDIQSGNPSPQIANPDGSYSTHLMSDSDNTAFPMIQRQHDGVLTQFDDWRKALGSARQNNDAIDFATPEQAGFFAQNYKHFWPKQ